MSARYTPGPWFFDVNHCHAGQIATLHGDDEGFAEIWSEQWMSLPRESQNANAMRIVSCVNALEGLSQDTLDGGWNFKDHGTAARNTEIDRDRLKALNAELAAALEAIELALRLPGVTAAEVLDENSPIRDAIRAALLKARSA